LISRHDTTKFSRWREVPADLQQKLIDDVKKRLAEEGISNIKLGCKLHFCRVLLFLTNYWLSLAIRYKISITAHTTAGRGRRRSMIGGELHGDDKGSEGMG
jgi:hypothetical protein